MSVNLLLAADLLIAILRNATQVATVIELARAEGRDITDDELTQARFRSAAAVQKALGVD